MGGHFTYSSIENDKNFKKFFWRCSFEQVKRNQLKRTGENQKGKRWQNGVWNIKEFYDNLINLCHNKYKL